MCTGRSCHIVIFSKCAFLHRISWLIIFKKGGKIRFTRRKKENGVHSIMRTIHNYRNLITPVINRILSRTIKCSKAHNLNASASVEGAIVIPLFIYAVMSIMFIMQVIAVRIHINNAFYVTLRKCAGYVYVYENSGNVPKGMVAETIRRLLIDEIGTDYAADHNIMGGNAGIMFMSSKILNNNSVIDIKLTYSIKNPFDIFGLSTIRVTDRKRINAWLGEDKDNFAGNVSDKEYVYITAGAKYIILIRNVHIC